MDKREKRFLVSTVTLSVVILVIMTIVAILIPKKHFVMILVTEIVLAVVWTILSACNIVLYIKHKDRLGADKPGDTQQPEKGGYDESNQ